MKTIIGIDGGKSGAIAVAKDGKLEIYKMPQRTLELHVFFGQFDKEETIIFIEKVSAFAGEDRAKQFAIIKMLEQVKELKTILRILNLKCIDVASVTWQSRLGLRFKGMSKKERKNQYWNFAKRYAPQNQIHKYAGDAVCILACGLKLIKEDDPLVGGINYPEEF